MRLIIFGPQGAGKGTQSVRISEKYAIPSVSTGDIFRWAISGRTALGLKAGEYVAKGLLVPDEVTIGVVQERLSADDAHDGFLLDGFPRNLKQAEALDTWLVDHKGGGLDAALAIEVPNDVSLRRLTGRRVCGECGTNYSVENPPKLDWTCDRCGGQVQARADDLDEETIRERLELYHKQTEPLKVYYEDKGLLRLIDGQGSPDEVFDRIVAAL
ncbi:MAG: adenylate kinase [Actinomycetota bacterium]|nr:adenylate kinase [Actinomycetota bacterium]